MKGEHMDAREFKKQMMNYSRRISDTMNCTFGPACEHLGLTILQLQIVMELYQKELHTIGSLAESMHMAKANMSTMCKKMEKMGVAERNRDKLDERVVRVSLTAEGDRIGAQIEESIVEKITQVAYEEDESLFEDIILGFEKFTMLIERITEIEEGQERKEN
jgi:DNA-binding MarR family transcriptional regulator